MPTLYDEGEQAFRRLQEEILKRIPDQSLFAWGVIYRQLPRDVIFEVREGREASLFASSRMFDDSSEVVPASDTTMRAFRLPPLEFAQTPYGIRMRVCLIPFRHTRLSKLASLSSHAPFGTGWYW